MRFLRDEKIRSILYQLLTIVLFSLFVLYIAQNTAHNIESRGIKSGFDFLNHSSGFDITESPISYASTDSHWRVFLVGLLNTLIVSFYGIILATILGIFIGVARLSKNWIVKTLATSYIELFRNIPILLQILFWYNVVLAAMPSVRNSYSFFDSFFINQRGLFFPKAIFLENAWIIGLGIIGAIVLGWFVKKSAKKRLDEHGKETPVFTINLALFILIPLALYYISGRPINFEMPEFHGFNFKGGSTFTPEFLALLLALSVYTSSYIAEAIRSGIEAVNKGQKEAATSLGLSPMQSLKLVVLPQAIRVSIPPIINQYLNLIKNSSLAAAIGFPELVTVFAGTSLNVTGQALEIIAITMLTYLIISLIVSFILNVINKKLQIKER